MVQYNAREGTEITYRTHVLGGIAVAAIVTNIAARGQLESLPPLTTPAVFGSFVSAMIGSALPDIDQPTSTVGKTLPVVSRLMCGAFGHRGAACCRGSGAGGLLATGGSATVLCFLLYFTGL